MQTFRIETIISEDNLLTLRGVPFRAGEPVEVIILSQLRKPSSGNPYPLRGKAIRYISPFDPVAESDWDALR